MTVGQLALSVVTDHSNLGVRSLAGILRAKVKQPMTEAASISAIRRARTKLGYETQPATSIGDWSFPEGDSQATIPYVIDGPARVLVCGDWHCPYHDAKALKAMVDFARSQFDLTHAVLNGDIQDFYQVSRHCRNREMRDVVSERDVTVECLAIFGEALSRKTKRVFRRGNHDLRLDKFLWTNAAELSKAPELRLERWLMLAELGYEYAKDSRVQIGSLSLFHGHELNLNDASVIPARSVFLKVLMDAACNHVHYTSRYSAPVGDRSRTITCHTIACLCDLEPEYAPVNRWNLGFAVVEVHKNGETELHNFSMNRRDYKPVEV